MNIRCNSSTAVIVTECEFGALATGSENMFLINTGAIAMSLKEGSPLRISHFINFASGFVRGFVML